jgi:hypothetical protein
MAKLFPAFFRHFVIRKLGVHLPLQLPIVGCRRPNHFRHATIETGEVQTHHGDQIWANFRPLGDCEHWAVLMT